MLPEESLSLDVWLQFLTFQNHRLKAWQKWAHMSGQWRMDAPLLFR
jgi:hypothetical protein